MYIQDLSYYCCIELQGEEQKLLASLSQLTSKEAGEYTPQPHTHTHINISFSFRQSAIEHLESRPVFSVHPFSQLCVVISVLFRDTQYDHKSRTHRYNDKCEWKSSAFSLELFASGMCVSRSYICCSTEPIREKTGQRGGVQSRTVPLAAPGPRDLSLATSCAGLNPQAALDLGSPHH